MKLEQIKLHFNGFWTLLGLTCVLFWGLVDYSERFLSANKNSLTFLLHTIYVFSYNIMYFIENI